MYRTILLAYDGTREGRLALREGAMLAKAFQSHIVLLAVVEHTFMPVAIDVGVAYVPNDQSDEYQKGPPVAPLGTRGRAKRRS